MKVAFPLTDGINGITMSGALLPSWFTDGEEPWLLAQWVRHSVTASRWAVGVEGLFYLRTLGASTRCNFINVTDGTGSFHEIASLGGQSSGDLRLCLISYNPSTGLATLAHATDSTPNGAQGSTDLSALDPPFVPGPHGGDLNLAQRVLSPLHGATGNILGLSHSTSALYCGCLRRTSVAASSALAKAMWDSRDVNAPMNHVGDGLNANDDRVGWLTGWSTGGNSQDSVSVVQGTLSVGEPLVNGNVMVPIHSGSSAMAPSTLLDVRPVTVHGATTEVASHLDDDHFLIPEVGASGTVGNSNIFARMARFSVDGHRRILASGNSRAIRNVHIYPPHPSIGLGDWYTQGGHFFGGYICELMDHDPDLVTGVINARQFNNATGGSSANRQFVFDNTAGGLYVDGTVGFASGNELDFTRWWTNSGSSGTPNIGPGRVLGVSANTSYGLSATHTPGTRFTKDNSLLLEYTWLAYPGAPNFSWAAVESATQSGAGSATSGTNLVDNADTTVLTHTMTGDDAYDAGTREVITSGAISVAEVLPTLTLQGVHAIEEEWSIYIADGTGAGSHAEVDSVEVVEGDTVITLRHHFQTSPTTGSALRFGPWEYRTIAAVVPASDDDYRRINFTTTTQDHGKLWLMAPHATCVDESGNPIPGYSLGGFGWGGHGYRPQIKFSIRNQAAKLANHLGIDMFCVHGGFQQSLWATEGDYPPALHFAAQLSDHSNSEAVLCGDAMLSLGAGTGGWTDFLLDQDNFPAISAMGVVGRIDQQIALGEIHDTAHPTITGMTRLARETFAIAARRFFPVLPQQCITDADKGVFVEVGHRRPIATITHPDGEFSLNLNPGQKPMQIYLNSGSVATEGTDFDNLGEFLTVMQLLGFNVEGIHEPYSVEDVLSEIAIRQSLGSTESFTFMGEQCTPEGRIRSTNIAALVAAGVI